MGRGPPGAGKCFFTAWIFAWVTAIFLPSGIIAAAGLSPLAQDQGIGTTLAVADEVAPAAKLAFGILFGLLALAARRMVHLRRFARIAADMAGAAAVMFLTLALLPPDWSRGFGVGLSGERFAPLPTIIYLGAALLAGLIFSLAETRCRAAETRRRERQN